MYLIVLLFADNGVRNCVIICQATKAKETITLVSLNHAKLLEEGWISFKKVLQIDISVGLLLYIL